MAIEDRRLYVAFVVPSSRTGYSTNPAFNNKKANPLPRAIIIDASEDEAVIEKTIPAETYIRQAGYRVCPSSDVLFLTKEGLSASNHLGRIKMLSEKADAEDAEKDRELQELEGDLEGLTAEVDANMRFTEQLKDGILPEDEDLDQLIVALKAALEARNLAESDEAKEETAAVFTANTAVVDWVAAMVLKEEGKLQKSQELSLKMLDTIESKRVEKRPFSEAAMNLRVDLAKARYDKEHWSNLLLAEKNSLAKAKTLLETVELKTKDLRRVRAL